MMKNKSDDKTALKRTELCITMYNKAIRWAGPCLICRYNQIYDMIDYFNNNSKRNLRNPNLYCGENVSNFGLIFDNMIGLLNQIKS